VVTERFFNQRGFRNKFTVIMSSFWLPYGKYSDYYGYVFYMMQVEQCKVIEWFGVEK